MEGKEGISWDLIHQGAEAKIFLDKKEGLVIKDRISKSYRIPELDKKIRKHRTKAEKKLLAKSSEIINSAYIKDSREENRIIMDYIGGEKLSTSLNNLPANEQLEIIKKLGDSVAKLHEADIIHGDLTTSNIILKGNEIFFIDFGLGYISKKIEDKAVDLHLLRQALEAKHFEHWKELFKKLKESYSKSYKDSEKIFARMIAIERRGRYRH